MDQAYGLYTYKRGIYCLKASWDIPFTDLDFFNFFHTTKIKQTDTMEKTYYMWRDVNGVYYITDYLEQADGLTRIDGYGFMEVELVVQGPDKAGVVAQTIALEEEQTG